MDTKGYERLKAIRHIAMGVVFLAFAVVMFVNKTFGAFDLSDGLAYSLGGVLVLYGAFRIWRGYADMKMLKRDN